MTGASVLSLLEGLSVAIVLVEFAYMLAANERKGVGVVLATRRVTIGLHANIQIARVDIGEICSVGLLGSPPAARTGLAHAPSCNDAGATQY